jgi:CBS domain containing-hemolysin-like protein
VATAAQTGHTRLIVRDASAKLTGLVHVRDAYLARSRGRTPAASSMVYPVPVLTCDTPLAQAVTTLQSHHSQLGLVQDASGHTIGLISLDDLLTNLLTPA